MYYISSVKRKTFFLQKMDLDLLDFLKRHPHFIAEDTLRQLQKFWKDKVLSYKRINTVLLSIGCRLSLVVLPVISIYNKACKLCVTCLTVK